MKPMHHHIRILNRLRRGFGTAALLGILIPQLAVANPLGPQVISGQASFATQGRTLSVTNSDRAIINWQNFSIANGELTRFIQPTATSAVLNRVIGNNPSAIYGALQSNGRVYLVNQNGIFMGPTATIDVNGLIASTLNITDNDFKAGRINFSGGPLAGKIENQGAIRTPAGGSIYLIAPDVTNSGIINAPNGDILLAAGQQVSLVESTTPEIAVVISAPENQILNLGRIIAEAGRIGIYGGLIQHRGIVSADSAVMDKTGAIHFRATNDITFDKDSRTTANGPKGGTITVQSAKGTTLVSGAVEAKGSSDRGGTVQLLGRRVGVIDAAQIDASGEQGGGTVLVGGDYQGKNPAVPNAEATYFGKDAIIKADANTNGDGGKVILWGNGATRSYGSISARGGEQSGNGGFVETSGAYLDVQCAPDVWAPKGAAGLWLLDPEFINIFDAGAPQNMPAVSPFQPVAPGTPGILQCSVLEAYLNSTGSAIVNTTSTSSNTGQIQVNNEIAWTSANSLTLKSDNDILINSAINGPSGTLTLNAPGSISQGTAPTQLINVSKLELLGGGFTLDNPLNNIGTLAGTVGSLSLKNNAPLTIGSVNTTNGLTSGGAIAVSNTVGSIDVANTSATTDIGAGSTLNLSTNAINGTISMASGAAITAGSGATLTTNLQGSTISIGSGTTITASTGDILIKTQNVTSGITLNGGTFTAGSGNKAQFESTDPATSISVAGNVAGNNLVYKTNILGTAAKTTTTGSITILPATTGGSVSFGGGGLLVLPSGNLSTVFGTPILRIGQPGAGEKAGGVSFNFNISGLNILSIFSSSAVSQGSTVTIGATKLQVTAPSVTLTENNTVDYLAGAATGGNFIYNSINSMSVDTIDGVAGITNRGGAVTLTANGSTSDISVNALITTGYASSTTTVGNAGAVSLTAGRDILLGQGTVIPINSDYAIIDTSVLAGGTGTTTGYGGNIDLTAVGSIIGTAIGATKSNLVAAVAKNQSGSTGSPAGNITLIANGGNVTVGNLTTSTYQNDTDGTIGNAGVVSVTASGSISVGAIDTQAYVINNIGGATTIGNGGNVTLTATTGGVTLNGTVDTRHDRLGLATIVGGNSGNLTATAGGAISQVAAAAISGKLLTTSSVGGTTLTGTNAVSTFNATNTTSGAISFKNTALPLEITSISQSGSDTEITNTGNISITGEIGGNGITTLNSGGTIGQSGVGKITAIGGLVANSTGGMTLNGPNTLNKFSAINGSSGNIELTNAMETLTIGGISNTGGGNVTINHSGGAGGGMALNGNITTSTTTGVVTLVSSVGGAMTRTAGTITGSSFSANAVTGIGAIGSPLKTTISTLNATSDHGDIVITNTGALIINTLNTGNGTSPTGNILINNTGSVTTGVSLVKGYNDVTISANSPLTIGAGGVTSMLGNINLTAGATGAGVTTDILTLNGPLTATGGTPPGGGNVTLSAGNEIIENSAITVHTPGGVVTKTASMNGPVPPPPPPTCTGGQYWDGTACVCPTGQSLSGYVCQPIICPTGQQLVGGVCQPIICPTGQQLVGNTCQAITCPTGQQLVGNTCQAITCPTGQQLVGNTCQPIICPTGQQLVGNTCQPITCPTGQQLVGNTCQAIICPTGQQLVGSLCEPIICPTGQQLVGNTCQAITCPTGQQLVGNLCQPIICTGGQQLVGNLCTCPGGQVLIGAGCQCPAGTIDYAGVCKTPSIVPGTDTTTVIYFPVTEELSEPLQVLVESIINTVAPSLFRTSGSGSPGGGAGDDLKPKKNYCN